LNVKTCYLRLAISLRLWICRTGHSSRTSRPNTTGNSSSRLTESSTCRRKGRTSVRRTSVTDCRHAAGLRWLRSGCLPSIVCLRRSLGGHRFSSAAFRCRAHCQLPHPHCHSAESLAARRLSALAIRPLIHRGVGVEYINRDLRRDNRGGQERSPLWQRTCNVRQSASVARRRGHPQWLR